MAAEKECSQLDILYDVSRELAGSLELHEVLERTLILSSQNLTVERASLIVLGKGGVPIDSVVLYKGKVMSTDPQGINDILLSGLAGWVLRNKQPALIQNTQEEPRWHPLPYEGVMDETPKSALCVPVIVQNQIVALLTLVHLKLNYFNRSHLQLLQSISEMAGIAIRNAELYRDLQQNRDLYRGLFEGVSDPILVTDLAGRMIEFNHQARVISGFSRRELLKTNIFHLDGRAINISFLLQKEKRILAFKTYETRLRIKDGEEIPVEARVTLNKNQDHEFMQWIYHDTRDQNQLEALRESLTAMIYHDLRSPLANIISSLELLSESIQPGQSPQVNQLLNIASRSSAHMQRLISSLMDIKRLESGQEIIKKSNVNLEQLINEAVEISTPLILSKEIQTEILIPEPVPLLDADEDMLRRVILNLLDNAIKYSPLYTIITIGVKQSPGQVIFYIEDQGPGIPDTFRERIFEKYFRLDDGGRSRGLGLGLAFCQLAVQAHGGTIWMENISPVGSRFLFSLPLSVNEKGPKEG